MSASTGPAAIIFGATGAVGKPLVAELIASSYYSKVHAVVRRPFKQESPHKDEAKLVEHVIDFENILKATSSKDGGSSSDEVKAVRDIGAEAIYITCEFPYRATRMCTLD